MSHPDPHNDPDNTYPVRKFSDKKRMVSSVDVTKKFNKMARKVSLSAVFPGEAHMDKIKARFGSDNNYKNRARVMKAYKKNK